MVVVFFCKRLRHNTLIFIYVVSQENSQPVSTKGYNVDHDGCDQMYLNAIVKKSY